MKLSRIDVLMTRNETSNFLSTLSIITSTLFLLSFNTLQHFSKQFSHQYHNLDLHLSDFTLLLTIKRKKQATNAHPAAYTDAMTLRTHLFAFLN